MHAPNAALKGSLFHVTASAGSKRKKENLEAPQTHAPPWKSGASAPRPPSQNQPGFSPCGRRSRATCCEGARPELAEGWDSTTPPLRTLGAPRPRRARLHSCRKTTATPRTTVEERRFSAASTIPKPTGLQPLWTPFSCQMLQRSLSRACRRVGFHASTSGGFGSAATRKGETSAVPSGLALKWRAFKPRRYKVVVNESGL